MNIPDKKYCIGCDSDFYNGKNPLRIEECWHFKNAKVEVRYAIGVDTPQDKKENFWEVTTHNCHTKTGHVVFYGELPKHLC